MLTLPEDVLYIILSHLDTAKDILSLLLTSKHLRKVIQADHNEGWRIFVRARFPSMTNLPTTAYTWDQLADSLTWQTRAWARRSVYFQALLPTPTPTPTVPREPRNRGRGGQRMSHRPQQQQQTAFHPVVDARADWAAREDLVVWGAGENIVARRRKGRRADWSPDQTLWHHVDGKELGYRAGYDDITALSIVEGVGGKAGDLGMLVGRDNGHLAFLSAAAGDFGHVLADLSPRHAMEIGAGRVQENINDIDVHQSRVAVAAKSSVLLYSLPEDFSSSNIAPSVFLSFAASPPGDSWESVGGAKWMGQDTLALGLSGSKDALRYVKVTPAGFEDVVPVRNTALEARFSIDPDKSRLCTGSLAPIDASSIIGGGGSTLLLSAWRDGTVRLQDLRTPTPLDLVYCDNIDPYSEFEKLLPFSTSHFIAAGSHGATIKVFDFRWPRQYYHTTALPCGADAPIPRPHQPFLRPPRTPRPPCDHCAPMTGRMCRWHALSQDIYHRPNGTFFFSKSLPRASAYASVWSLAAGGGSLSPNFYIGISGGVVEASLATATQLNDGEDGGRMMDVDPRLGYVPCVEQQQQRQQTEVEVEDGGARPGRYYVYDLDASLMETGDGMLDRGNERNVRMPMMRGTGWRRMTEEIGGAGDAVGRHRLDVRYHALSDFDAIGLGMGDKEERRWAGLGDVGRME